MNGTALYEFFDEYPVLPVAVLVTNLPAFLPIVFILYISQIAPLHNNCKYILCIWVLGFGASFVVNIALAILDLQTGYMPLSMFEPRRLNLYQWYTMCGTFSSSCEIVLSTERIVSIIHPNRYHFSRVAWKTLTLLTISMMAFSYGVDHFVHNVDQTKRLIGTLILFFIEVAVLATGFVARRICQTKYERKYGDCTLITRYQTKEAHEMSKAMIPAYLLSFAIKQSSIIVLSAYFAYNDMSLTGYAQDYLLLTTALNGIFSMINLLSKHPQLRVHSIRKLRIILRMKPTDKKRKNSVAADTDVYFSMLSASWK